MEDAQKNMNLEGMASLEAEEIIREHEVGPPRRIKVVMARGEKYLCRACLHSFFIDRQSAGELRITRIPRDAVI